jgi:23S rRNA (pseudouridine1915-N3)-methyltransferase
MEIHLLAIGTRMPAWINDGFADYAKRFSGDCKLVLREIPTPRKSRSEDAQRVKQLEGKQLLAAVPADAYLVALDLQGRQHNTENVAQKLENWFQQYRQVALMVGGADGLSDECLAASRESWSLSNLTFPHALVRVIVAEQIYRAYSLLKNHPYHRA